jgi:hypothetical protein
MSHLVSDLNRVRYSGFDFSSHEDEIFARLQVKFAATFNDFAVSSLGILLVDVFSFGLDSMSFYVDRRATDQYLFTARTRKSAAKTSRQLGYKMAGSVASSVELEVQIVEAQTVDTVLPVGFQFIGTGGLIFEAQESVTWPAGTTPLFTVTASEGETVSSTFTSDGTSNQVFKIANVPGEKFVVGPGSDGISKVVVEVDGDPWAEVELLIFGDNNQFEIGYSDDPPTLKFGDGIVGNIPPATATIVITYFATSGVLGQSTAGTITNTAAPLIANFNTVDLTVNNPQGTSGGADPESVTSAKANAPLAFKSRGVNITREDYETRAATFRDPVFGAISVAQAVRVESSSTDAFLQSLLADLTLEFDALQALIPAAVTSMESALDDLDAEVVIAQDADTILEAKLSAIDSDANSAVTAADTGKTSTSIAQTTANAASTDISAMVATVTQYDEGGVLNEVHADDRAYLLKTLNTALANTQEAATQAGTANSDTTTIRNELDTLLVSSADAEAQRAVIRTAVDEIAVDSATVRTTAVTLESDAEALEDNFDALITAIDTHVDSFLSADCKVNLIDVPVLTLDSDGFYVAPTQGLLASLQKFLDAKKEVTQVVKVVGANSLLVLPTIVANVGVIQGYSESSIRSQVEAAFLGVLKNRAFGAPLNLSELYGPTSPDSGSIEGVSFINISITEPSTKLDPDGNLEVEDFEVVTRGTFSISSEIDAGTV